jgi:hypothetical protein
LEEICSLLVLLISHQPAVLFTQNKPATSNQPVVLFSQNKSAPAISHQPNEQTPSWLQNGKAALLAFCKGMMNSLEKHTSITYVH